MAGKAAIDRKDWDVAAKRLAKSLVRHPENPDLHNYLGFAYRNLKQFDRAFEHYKRAIAIDPRHRGAHEYIGEAYLWSAICRAPKSTWPRSVPSACSRARNSPTSRRRRRVIARWRSNKVGEPLSCL